MLDFRPFARARTFHTDFLHGVVRYSVDIAIPDLTSNRRCCWGDWGPMYTVYLNPRQSITLAYRSASCSQGVVHVLRPATLRFDSPMFADERVRHPLVLSFEDEPRGLGYAAQLDPGGAVDSTVVDVKSPGRALDRLLFSPSGEAVGHSRAVG